MHAVAVGLSNGELLEECSIRHDKAGFNQFFTHIEKHEKSIPIRLRWRWKDTTDMPDHSIA